MEMRSNREDNWSRVNSTKWRSKSLSSESSEFGMNPDFEVFFKILERELRIRPHMRKYRKTQMFPIKDTQVKCFPEREIMQRLPLEFFNPWLDKALNNLVWPHIWIHFEQEVEPGNPLSSLNMTPWSQKVLREVKIKSLAISAEMLHIPSPT